MEDARRSPDDAARRRAQIQRRAKRGLVASYIHGLSERHGRDAAARAELVPAREQATG